MTYLLVTIQTIFLLSLGNAYKLGIDFTLDTVEWKRTLVKLYLDRFVKYDIGSLSPHQYSILVSTGEKLDKSRFQGLCTNFITKYNKEDGEKYIYYLNESNKLSEEIKKTRLNLQNIINQLMNKNNELHASDKLYSQLSGFINKADINIKGGLNISHYTRSFLEEINYYSNLYNKYPDIADQFFEIEQILEQMQKSNTNHSLLLNQLKKEYNNIGDMRSQLTESVNKLKQQESDNNEYLEKLQPSYYMYTKDLNDFKNKLQNKLNPVKNQNGQNLLGNGEFEYWPKQLRVGIRLEEKDVPYFTDKAKMFTIMANIESIKVSHFVQSINKDLTQDLKAKRSFLKLTNGKIIVEKWNIDKYLLIKNRKINITEIFENVESFATQDAYFDAVTYINKDEIKFSKFHDKMQLQCSLIIQDIRTIRAKCEIKNNKKVLI